MTNSNIEPPHSSLHVVAALGSMVYFRNGYVMDISSHRNSLGTPSATHFHDHTGLDNILTAGEILDSCSPTIN